MGNFLPKYPKNYFKNQKGLRSFWKMISIGISIIFGILACIDKFEKQWEIKRVLLWDCFTAVLHFYSSGLDGCKKEKRL